VPTFAVGDSVVSKGCYAGIVTAIILGDSAATSCIGSDEEDEGGSVGAPITGEPPEIGITHYVVEFADHGRSSGGRKWSERMLPGQLEAASTSRTRGRKHA
jgi:hypothetical protein